MIAVPAGAQTTAENGDETPPTLGGDIKAYVTAPIHARGPQWVRFGASLGAIAVAYQYDDQVRAHFVPTPGPQPGADTQDASDALPAALVLGATWAAALVTHDEDGQKEARSMFEAAVFSSASALVIKQVAGRERPFETGDPHDWNNGGSSFPSGHTTAAFAIGTVLAESGNDRYRWLRRVLGYGVGAATAYQRLNHDAHWFSDTVAGAALGVATGRFVLKRRELEAHHARLGIAPIDGGLEVSYMVSLR